MPGSRTILIGRRVLITGGRGRLAGTIRDHLRARGASVTAVSREAGPAHVGIEKLWTDGLAACHDALLHLAWSTVPLVAERSPGSEAEHDLPLLRRVLDEISGLVAPSRPHFVFFSSGGAVYGNAEEGKPSRETDACHPVGAYGRAKLAAESLIQEYAERFGLTYTILRISNPYGMAVQANVPQGVIPFIVQHAKAGTPFTIWGDGTARKDFLYHTDFLAALEQVLILRPMGVFNVAYGQSHTINDVISLVEEATKLRVLVNRLPGYAWDVHDSVLENTKIRSAVAWSPKISLAKGISRVCGGEARDDE